MTKMWRNALLCLGLTFGAALVALGQDKAADTPAEAEFRRGFFLQVHERDAAGAATAYEKAAADPSATDSVRAGAKARLAQVREDIASANLASLMPPDCMAYAELVEPGEHIVRILKMMDLVGPPAGGEKPTGKPVRLGDGFQLPADFAISPALVNELKKLRGAAVGLTAISEKGQPEGLIVIHPGDCDLVRGVIETGVQLLETGEPIEGYKSYRIPDLGWVVLTARLVLVSDSREQLAATMDRMRNPQAANLAASASFKRAAGDSKGALLFAYVDGPQAVKRFGPMLKGQEAAIIRTLADLEHLESLVVALTTTDSAIQLRAQLNLMSGHHNMLYALIRTAPVTKRSLVRVPKGAAGVLVVGLNPAGPAAAPAADEQNPPSVSAMDIGREFFNNIEELSVFAMAPAVPTQTIPDVGVVVAVKDPAKSEALWNQILSLATLVGARQPKPSAEISIESKAGRVYHFDSIPPVVVLRSDREMIIGTENAVAASVRSQTAGTIAQDPAFASLLARLTPDTSKALLVDVGRAVEIAAAMSGARGARELKAVGELTRETKFSIVTDEAPNQLTVRAELTGLPKFQAILSFIESQQRPQQAKVAE
jgi:hypothetical protein